MRNLKKSLFFILLLTIMSCSTSPSNSDTDRIAQTYIFLAFQLENHVPGFIDAYFGPEEFKIEAGKTFLTTGEIVSESRKLINDLYRDTTERTMFLKRQLSALNTVARRASGEEFSFLEETELIYDIKPVKIEDAVYESALEEIDRLLPGNESLNARVDAYWLDFEIPEENVLELFELAEEEARARTHQFIQMPDGENFSIEMVTEKPWSGYNWFKGNSSSLIQFNLDLPRRIDQILHLMTHEAYPGHHTELSIREERIYIYKNALEYSIYPLYSPQSVISEGVAELAQDVIFTPDESLSFIVDVLAPEIGLKNIDRNKLQNILQALSKLRSVAGNAAIMLLHENRTEDEVYEYLRKFGLLSEGYARKRIEFIKTYRGYIFTYYMGYDILKEFIGNNDLKEQYSSIVSDYAYPSKFFTLK